MIKRLLRLLNDPKPLRFVITQKLRCRIRGFHREHYLVCVERAAQEAVGNGLDRISVIEFGVAAGNGLLEIESICDYLESKYPIKFDIYGFDTGTGLPQSQDYRDTPWKWTEGWYDMDVEKLESRLQRSALVLGEVSETIPQFLREKLNSPIGAVMFDLDYYSSTASALKLLSDCNSLQILPRVLCYFDDIGSIEDVGVLRAIHEFNEGSEYRRVKPQMFWQNHDNPYVKGWKIYEFHQFDHPLYQNLVRKENVKRL